MMSSMVGGMGIPGLGRKSATRKNARAQGQEGQEGRLAARRRRRSAARSVRHAGHAGRVPRPVADARGSQRIAARAGRLRPVQAEVPGQQVVARAHARARDRAARRRPRSNCGSSTAASAASRSPAPTPFFDGGWILPGLVDAHCHVGLGRRATSHSTRRSRRPRPNATSARCCCATAARRPTPAASTTTTTCPASSGPDSIWPGPSATRLASADRARRRIAAAGRGGRSRRGAATAGSSWSATGSTAAVGDLAPLWSDDVLKAAIDAAHAHGARVTAHVFSEDALPGLINAGIDCIEHGTGLTDDTIELMVEHGTALVPTLINVENFPGIADAAANVSRLRRPHARPVCPLLCRGWPRPVRPACRSTPAATPAAWSPTGGSPTRSRRSRRIGMSPTEALGAACWDARRWLGRPGLDHGASADLLCYYDDPRYGPEVLHRADVVVLRGQFY